MPSQNLRPVPVRFAFEHVVHIRALPAYHRDHASDQVRGKEERTPALTLADVDAFVTAGGASGAVDSLRVAVLAALNLADECFRLRQEADSKHSSGAAVDERAMRLARKLGAALGE